MKNIIGVIGGNGVAATNKLQELIEIELTKNGAYRDCHHPEMIIWQATKAPSRSMYYEAKGESFIPDYIDIAKKLKSIGVTKLCMCCNTAHGAIDEIAKATGVEFINLVEECVKKVCETKIEKVGLIASDGCLKQKVYEKYFEKICPEIEIIYPDEDFQNLVTRGICNIKNIRRFDDVTSEENPENIFKTIKKHLIKKGAQKIILGCTDIRVGYWEEDNIDSLEVLKELIIKGSGEI